MQNDVTPKNVKWDFSTRIFFT